MLDHLVLFRFLRHLGAAAIDSLIDELRHLAQSTPGVSSFRVGAYDSPEGLNRGYTHGFVMTFMTEAARDAYLTHPDHLRVVDKLLPMLEGGLDGVLAFDLIHGQY
jgi:hypothetical protein